LIASEGKIIIVSILIMVMIAFILNLFFLIKSIKLVILMLIILLAFNIYFFRDPIRVIPPGDNFISPADGKIININQINDSDLGESILVSIFLSIWDVHCQTVPSSGKIILKRKENGKNILAYKRAASEKNTSISTIIETEIGIKYKIKQITGMIARRILNYMETDCYVKKGQRLGFIMFGSRVDIVLPKNFNLYVSLGEKVIGNKTIIGNFI
tara:strand:- start:214 stop:852 length:639 start_codon:yes stop_codon:yes gene_type:complete